MRLGLYLGGAGSTLDAMHGKAAEAARLGYDGVFFSQILSWDSLTVAALLADRAPGIDVGTAVVQTYPRHPIALAGQALTAQAASRNRLTLSIGPSHPPVIEDVFGYTYEPPARHLRDYLAALGPLLRGSGPLEVPGAEPPSVLVSALGPAMLRVAGELADGTVTV